VWGAFVIAHNNIRTSKIALPFHHVVKVERRNHIMGRKRNESARLIGQPTTKKTEDNETVFFFGPNNENGQLSQFYISAFDNPIVSYGDEQRNRRYCCAEQFFQFAKARFAGDTASCSTWKDIIMN
jgi:hypothetical protein